MSKNILDLFEGQELTEEFKASVVELFNEAVAAQVAESVDEATAELQKVFEDKTAERMAELENLTEAYLAQEVVPQLMQYQKNAIAEWKADNQVALTEGAKVALAEKFLRGVVSVAEAFNVSIPSTDLMNEVKAELSHVKAALDEVTARNALLVSEKTQLVRESIVAVETATLSDAQKDKLSEAVKAVEFKSESQFAQAVKSLVESTFPAEVQPVQEPAQIVEDKQPITETYAQRTLRLALKG